MTDDLSIPPFLDRRLPQEERDEAWAAEVKPKPKAKKRGPPTWEELLETGRAADRETAAKLERQLFRSAT